MFRRTKPLPRVKPDDERTALTQALIDAGQDFASACGVCGASVAVNDPEAVRTTLTVGKYPYTREARSWRYHRVCSRAASGAPLLALVLDPEAYQIRVTQAHADVARKLGAPLAYADTERAASTDRGRSPWKHVPRAELAELRAAVEHRHRELTVPVLDPSGWPCAVCGRSHELVDAWGEFEGRPVCGACFKLVERSLIPGNRALVDAALDVALPTIPQGRDLGKFGLARDMPGYSQHSGDGSGEREPWAFVVGLPEVAPTPEQRQEERLAKLEERLAGAAS